MYHCFLLSKWTQISWVRITITQLITNLKLWWQVIIWQKTTLNQGPGVDCCFSIKKIVTVCEIMKYVQSVALLELDHCESATVNIRLVFYTCSTTYNIACSAYFFQLQNLGSMKLDWFTPPSLCHFICYYVFGSTHFIEHSFDSLSVPPPPPSAPYVLACAHCVSVISSINRK